MSEHRTIEERLWDHLVEHQCLIQLDDGSWAWWPTPAWTEGAFRGTTLRVLGNLIDKRNRENNERIAKALTEIKP